MAYGDVCQCHTAPTLTDLRAPFAKTLHFNFADTSLSAKPTSAPVKNFTECLNNFTE
jgi:hypothetical protein